VAALGDPWTSMVWGTVGVAVAVVGTGAWSLFFFQAEDGIRDRNVTGVQTCALPIWRRPAPLSSAAAPVSRRRATSRPRCGPFARSEERRVGKECRSGWRARQFTKNYLAFEAQRELS